MYLNVFRYYKQVGLNSAEYMQDSAQMEKLVRKQRGFLRFKRYSAADGEMLWISEWETEKDAHAWAHHRTHVATQKRGRSDYYKSYVVYSCPNAQVRRFDYESARSRPT